jgi:hypothetical protein
MRACRLIRGLPTASSQSLTVLICFDDGLRDGLWKSLERSGF